MNYKGVYPAKRKNGQEYFRASLTHKSKHIALGNFDDAETASRAYEEGNDILSGTDISIDRYDNTMALPFDKFVVLINLRDNKIYCPNPIYIHKNYISYYISRGMEMKFSVDDLFYYTTHRIRKRGGHLYVNDYGMQVSLGNRYGIKNYAVEGRDYRFVNGDDTDYRYENLEIINKYYGVSYVEGARKSGYRVKINYKGDLIVGYYDDAIKAAIAYNKAVDVMKRSGCKKEFPVNYIDGMNGKTYAEIYSKIRVEDYFDKRG